jgi:hypothetical protein
MRAPHVAAVLAGFMAVAVIGSSLRAQATQFELVTLPASLTNGVNTIDVGEIDVGENDGDLDLAIPEGPPWLWRNDGGMVFTDITATPLPVLPTTPASCSFGDVEEDGDVDLFVGGSPNSLDRVLLNDGTGSFTELLGAAPQGLVGLELHAQALLQEVTGPLGLRLTPMMSTTIQ